MELHQEKTGHFGGIKMIKYASEHDEQVAFVNWFRLNYHNYLIYSVPNSGIRSKTIGIRMKQEGLLKGVFDLQILTPDKEIIFIEFKRVKEANPKISKEQKEFKKFLDDNNYKNFFAFGFLDAMKKIKEVIDDKN